MGQKFYTSGMGILLIVLVSTVSADILFKKRPQMTLPTLPTFNIFPTGLLPTFPTTADSDESSSKETSSSPTTSSAALGSTIVPILTGLPSLDDNLIDQENLTTIATTPTVETDEEMLAQTILKKLESIEQKLDQIQTQLGKESSTAGQPERANKLKVPTVSPLPFLSGIPTGTENDSSTSGSLLDRGVLPTLPDLIGGGVGKIKSKDETVTGLIEKLKPEIHSKVCEKQGNDVCGPLDEFNLEVIEYRKQVVAGANYFVKAKKTNDETEWHLRIFHQSWTKTLQLTDIKGPLPKGQELNYF